MWLKAVTKLERVIGERVEKVVRADAYFDIVSEATRTGTRVARAVEGVSTCWLRMFNIPAGTDIRRMREQLNRMERRLTELTKEFENVGASDDEHGRAGAR
jgi:hypothetical protein